jgi:hypothetical protein
LGSLDAATLASRADRRTRRGSLTLLVQPDRRIGLQAEHDVPFEATIERARTILVGHIVQHGTFEITCLGGVLVCRR